MNSSKGRGERGKRTAKAKKAEDEEASWKSELADTKIRLKGGGEEDKGADETEGGEDNEARETRG